MSIDAPLLQVPSRRSLVLGENESIYAPDTCARMRELFRDQDVLAIDKDGVLT